MEQRHTAHGEPSPHHGHPQPDHHGHEHPAPRQSATAGAYVCPMHPEVRSDRPGRCPKCGMNLVLTDAREGAAHHADHAPSGHPAGAAAPAAPAQPQPREMPPQAARGTVYTCPMHPEVRQSAPGKCPKCGMDLEPARGGNQ